jgi:hypothetical protein
MTVIEVKQHSNAWKVFEAPSVEPVLQLAYIKTVINWKAICSW